MMECVCAVLLITARSLAFERYWCLLVLRFYYIYSLALCNVAQSASDAATGACDKVLDMLREAGNGQILYINFSYFDVTSTFH